ncbi:hypothetical protein CKQ80_11715 [Pseudomonas moraviensis]|uniref:Uncharacterized protein n=1 Tax=Pseudomonas moraviensis TaxID=321662 RepID=A0A2A2PKG5_9PSED|nr:hypothetical protein CKQ80_11715 [Pseudomonas moraviensis]PAW59433.1 hypothetical protein CKQ68_01460 [Pseudomonas moraviensis]
MPIAQAVPETDRLLGSRPIALSVWERACSRRRSISQPVSRLTHRFREQARSHRLCTQSL